MTVREALARGYETTGRYSLERGYVSRNSDPMDAELIQEGGIRPRKNSFYVLINNPNSTQYCFRMYLRGPETK